MNEIKKFNIINYGCQMNESDSEHYAGQIESLGYVVSDDYSDSDIILLNTCCIRESAEAKIYGKIGELKHHKDKNPNSIIIVAGCMAQKDGEQILKKYRQIDLIVGTFYVNRLSEILESFIEVRKRQVYLEEQTYENEFEGNILRKSSFSAWIPIMYGCNNFCTYCIVPYVRGRERSRSKEDIIKEVTYAATQGYKEITLLGQNVNSYGKDLSGKTMFAELLKEVDEVKGIERIRFMTSHPRDMDESVIKVIANGEHLCEHFHLPVQAGSDEIIKSMNRGYSQKKYLELIDAVRMHIPGASISTDIIVGFPGESNDDFEATLDVVEKVQYDAAYTFLYSPRSGTIAAKMADQVPMATKKERLSRLMDIQNNISLDKNKKLLNTIQEVMVEGKSTTDKSNVSGRTRTNRIVIFPDTAESLLPGDLAKVSIKKAHHNEILFFRLGDFYEMFFDDAVLASKELEITLTGRDAGMPDRIPMCGVPYHAVEGYITKLIKKGFRIAICEQVEDPKIAKGIVKREVVKIITPGTVMSDQILEDKSNQYLALLYEENDSLVIAAADISTGDCLWNMCKGTDRYEKIKDFIYQINPAELVTVGVISDWNKIEEFCEHKIPKCVFTVYRINEEDDIDTIFEKNFSGVKVPKEIETAVSYLLSYLYSTLKSDLSHINKLTELSYDDTMVLDSTALRNLEILKNMRDNTKKDTLLSVLDFTFTAMGGRQLRRWLEMPLLNIDKIRSRQNVIKAFLNHPSEREDIISFLKKINDIERILSRIEVGTANARDLYALCVSLSVLPEIKKILNIFEEQDLRKISERFELNTALYNLLSSALVDDPPFSIREGGMIRDGFDIELDELKAISRESKKWMTDFEQNLKTTSGIKNLKVGYNKVFGYYIEVTKSNIDNVPDFFVRKQTLANAERYIVPELKEFENKILGAQERIANLEYHLFNNLREEVRKYIVSLQKTANILADIDAYMSLTIAADKYNYVCPNLNNNQEIIIKDGRHPVVERILVREMFVPNDTFLNMYDQRTIVITGPNMAGKSTYMRQVALLVLMTQVGSFIPVREASIAPVDRIFTRVGASDDLASGQSTFMLEMTEVAQIIRYATEKSLIILDEVGRGTSTYDGMSIAQSVIEYISSNIKAKTLFATHYHELIELEKCIDCLKNYSVAVKEKGNNVVFLRRIIPGGADKSYGIHVAELAGLPKKLLKRSQELLNEYSHTVECSASSCFSEKTLDKNDIQNTLFQSIITQELANIDIVTMTPLEALNKLSELQKQAKQEIGLP